jgi:hypothetical protein
MKITSAKPLSHFQLQLSFDNGESGVVDLADFAGRGVFEIWLRPGIFEQVEVTEFGAVQWPGEIDLCPDSLYLRMSGKKPADIFPTLQSRLTHA